jgi:exosortase
LSEGEAQGFAGLSAGLRSPFAWACALALVLGATVYLPLFFPPSQASLSEHGERFFFELNEAARGPVLLLALWLFYRRSHYRDVLMGPGAPVAGAALLASALALFGWGVYTGASDLRLASGIVLLFGVATLLGGRAGVRAYWLPILFLAFALPLSSVLVASAMFPIQLETAAYAGWLLDVTGFEAVVQGDQILRPDGAFVVIETCSGVRMMVTLAMLTVLMIDLFERRGWHAAILMVLAPIVAFGVNGLRVVTLVLNPHASIHSIHNLQGIAMLLAGLLLIYGIDGLLARWLGSDAGDGEAADYGMIRPHEAQGRRRAIGMIGVAGVLALMLGLDGTLPRWSDRRPLAETPAALLERVFGDALGPELEKDWRFTGSVLYLAEARRLVEIDGRPVEVFLGVADERRRAFSILTKRLAWPASGYAPVEESFVSLPPDGPRVRRMELRRGASRVLSYSWVERRGSWATEWLRQAAALDRSFLARPAHMIAVRLTTGLAPDETDAEAAEAAIREAWVRLEPELEDFARKAPR